MKPRVLVIEDGHEYIENLQRFLGEHFEFSRAGDGEAALDALAHGGWDVIYLDMRFDRAPRLLGDLEGLATRFAGDGQRARRFLEDNQGTYILAAIRDAGVLTPVLFSYDFDGEPRRFANLTRRHGPLASLPDTAGPAEIQRALQDLAVSGSTEARRR
jgi:CheY-like chemotaxis protein